VDVECNFFGDMTKGTAEAVSWAGFTQCNRTFGLLGEIGFFSIRPNDPNTTTAVRAGIFPTLS
jgi:hypothetical protein